MSDAANMIQDNEMKISAAAGEQLAGIMKNAEDGIEGIRIFVSGGGCGGMSYGMTYAETIEANDKILEGEGYKVVVDADALNVLKGCDIDFVEQGMSSSFVFNNVASAAASGCGSCSSSGGGCA